MLIILTTIIVPTTVEYRHHKPSYHCHEMTTCGNNIMCTINYAVESISIIAYHIYSRHYDVMKFSVTFYRDFFRISERIEPYGFSLNVMTAVKS